MDAPAIVLAGLSMRFGDTVLALDQISAALPRGQITGLVGPDAAGKTTLMRLLAGLMQPTQGRVDILGQSPETCAAEGLTGYMPQRFGLYEDLSVADNLALHARLRGLEGQARDALFARLLSFTSLTPFTRRLAGRLSGGMKQKLGIACALLGSPQILLLDEPGVGVDPQSRRDLWRMVQDLCGKGMSIVWSTAYLEEAERCPHIILLDQGRVLYEGAPEELTQRAAGHVFAVSPGPGEDSKTLLHRWSATAGVDDTLIQGGHIRLLLRDTLEEAPPGLRAALLAAGAEPLPARLEDSYMRELGGRSSADAAGVDAGPSPFGSGEPVCTTDTPPLRIEAMGLTRHFGEFVAAQDITFNVRAGQIFGLLGPNGAGKSTTFRMLCGLLRPTAGHCRVDGVDMLSAGGEARARLGYMAQKFSLYQDIPVRDNISIVGDLYGITPSQRARIPALMEALELTPYLHQTTASLPLGQKQRLALLCAALHQPPVLFLDEPTSGVDARTRREFWKHITAMTQSGTAVLVTTHFMEEAEYCDDIALVYRGGIIAQGTPDQLKREAPLSGGDTLPTLEDAFIAHIERYDSQHAEPEEQAL